MNKQLHSCVPSGRHALRSLTATYARNADIPAAKVAAEAAAAAASEAQGAHVMARGGKCSCSHGQGCRGAGDGCCQRWLVTAGKMHLYIGATDVANQPYQSNAAPDCLLSHQREPCLPGGGVVQWNWHAGSAALPEQYACVMWRWKAACHQHVSERAIVLWLLDTQHAA